MTTTLIELLWQTSWQAGLMALVVWLACRAWPRLPAALRTSLWWLVCLKFVVGLAWPTPIALAVLPEPTVAPDVTASSPSSPRPTEASPTAAVAELSTTAPRAASTRVSSAHGAATAAANSSSANGGSAQARSANPSSADARFANGGSAISRSANSGSANGRWRLLSAWPTIVALLWLVGVMVQGALLTRQFARTRALVERGRPVDDETAALFEELCTRVGLAKVPRLVASAEIVTPLVTGVRHPTVLVPEAMIEARATASAVNADATVDGRWSRPELAMTLCHELLHIRRRDLWHGWIPSAASHLFFFHPLAVLAAREYALAREAACDARVLHLLHAPADDYGRLIVRLGVRPRDAAPAAAGASVSFRTLERRLIMLHDASLHARAISPRWWIVGALAAITVLPVRLVAQPTKPRAESKARIQTNALSVSTPAPAVTSIAPVRATVARAAEGGQSRRSEKPVAHDSDNDGWGEPWVLLNGDQHSMSGSWSHVQEARRLQSSPTDRLLWFLRDGRPYVIRDASTLDAIEALWEPQGELGRQQGDLGARQGVLGAEQGNIGARQGDLGAQQAVLGARMNDANADLLAAVAAEMRGGNSARTRSQRAEAEARIRDLSNQMSDLGRRQAALGREQAALGEKQAVLGREQGALGQQQAALAKKAVQEMRGVIEKAIASGLAVGVP